MITRNISPSNPAKEGYFTHRGKNVSPLEKPGSALLRKTLVKPEGAAVEATNI